MDSKRCTFTKKLEAHKVYMNHMTTMEVKVSPAQLFRCIKEMLQMIWRQNIRTLRRMDAPSTTEMINKMSVKKWGASLDLEPSAPIWPTEIDVPLKDKGLENQAYRKVDEEVQILALVQPIW